MKLNFGCYGYEDATTRFGLEKKILSRLGSKLDEIMFAVDNNNVEQELKNIRRKIRLSDGERKAMYHELENKKRINEQYIQQLRADISELKQVKLKDKQYSTKTYYRILRNRQLVNIYKNKPLVEILEEIEQQVFDQRKKLDALLFKKNEMMERLQRLVKEESRQLKLAAEQIDSNPLELQLQQAQDRLEKVEIKIQECQFVTQQYDAIKEKLNEEQTWYKKQMDEMEEEIIKWIKEKKKMEQIKTLAIELRDDMIRDITNFERNIRKLKTKFEKQTQDKKMREKEERNEIIKALRRKSAPYSSRMWEEVLAQIPNPVEAAAEERELASLINYFEQIKNKTGIATPEEIIALSQTQEKTSNFLKEKEIKLTSVLSSAKQEEENLEKELQDLKYVESQKYRNTFDLIEEYKGRVAKKQEAINEVMAQVDNITEVIASVIIVLEEMAKKLKINHTPTNGKTTDLKETSLTLIRLCQEKMMHLQEEYEKVDPEVLLVLNEVPSSPPETLETEKFTADDLGNVYSKFLTRNVVKQMSRQITAAHAKMKKQTVYPAEQKTYKRRKQVKVKI